MASIVVVLIVLGCAAFQYFKGTLVKAFATIMIAICAGTAAFGYFELLANVIIGRGDGSLTSLVPWAQPLSFVLLFVLAFAIFQTAASQLLRNPIDLGFMPERIGRVVCGIFLGLIVSGFLFTAADMAPLSPKWPYQRFDPMSLKPEEPRRALLNVDGLATGLFSVISNGGLSGKRSFATIHPDYLDQLFLNRLLGSGVSVVSSLSPAIEVPKPAVWPASEAIGEQVSRFIEELKRSGGRLVYDAGKSVSLPVSTKGGYDPTMVRIGIKKRALRTEAALTGGTFTPGQLRLICKRKGYGEDQLTGEAMNVYPIGYLKTADQVQAMGPEMKIASSDFQGDANSRFIDFVFCVPNGFEPALVEFKLNSIAEIPRSAIVAADQAPEAAPFVPSAGGQGDTQRSRRSSSQPEEGGSSPPPARRGLSNVGRSAVGPGLDEE
ncbi:MAG: hypothetical protein ABIF19_01900 [Planctomycetota bacterium]